MENSKQPAFPLIYDGEKAESFCHDGLTKREYFAGVAMQGLLASSWGKKETEAGKASLILDQIIPASIQLADELLKQLEGK
jgi:hypothetical protein